MEEKKDFNWTSEATKGNRQTITITHDIHNKRQSDLVVSIIGLCNAFYGKEEPE
ncbi:hypothetical protein LCGC14_1454340 [marine sediment metagenome]|uniref:Uncharacterized protein n=1 Tax=marine sediment metagenome TaxID=412755 RepID=A0A0F9JHL2_9ZZZZ